MGSLVERGRTHSFFVSFLNRDGSEATISGTPTIEIYENHNGTITTKLSATNLSVAEGSTYTYNWSIPTAFKLADYVVKYRATYDDSTLVVTSEDITVVTADMMQAQKGAGLFKRDIQQATQKSKDDITAELKELRKYMGTLSIPNIIQTESPDNSTELTELLNKVRIMQDSMGVIAEKYELGEEKEQLALLGESMNSLGERLTNYNEDNSFQLAILKEDVIHTLNKLEDIRIKNMSDEELEREIESRLKPIKEVNDDE